MADKSNNAPCPYPSPLTKTRIRIPNGELEVSLPSNELFRIDNIFNRHEYDIPPRYLPTGDLLTVDIGANVGLFALYMKAMRPDCTIHCFEPVPPIVELLEINTGHCRGIHVHPFGLGDRNAVIPMALHPGNSGENSIKRIPHRSLPAMDVTIVAADTAFEQIGLGYIDILKIDTEGCEVDILGKLQSRLRYVGAILLEYHSDQDRRRVDDILSGFKLFDACVASTEGGTLKYINAALL